MNSSIGRPDCFECGRPVNAQPRWLVHAECREVLRLVWSGRSHRAGEVPPDMSVVRHQRRAAGIARFPSRRLLQAVWDSKRGKRSAPTCEMPTCTMTATRFGWQPSTENEDALPRAADISCLCDAHHQETAQAHVNADWRIPHTAAATWARIEAKERLVFHDDESYWDAGRSRLLTSWPFADEQTLGDYRDWENLWLANDSDDKWHVDEHGERWNETWNDIVEQLQLPRSRRRRLYRVVYETQWVYLLLTLHPAPAEDRMKRIHDQCTDAWALGSPNADESTRYRAGVSPGVSRSL